MILNWNVVCHIGFALLFGLTGNCLKADGAAAVPILSSDGNKIIVFEIANDVLNFPIMTFYVRYPKNVSPGNAVNGVFAYLIWITGKQELEDWIKRPGNQDAIFQFADEHQLVVVTWTTATEYSIVDSFDSDLSDERDPNNTMEICFRTWKTAMDVLSRNYNLPKDGYLIDGASRGAQWAHRIVLRLPERFLAVHIHVNSSFEEPTADASHCLWLLTTGELEHGSASARLFFHKGQALGYPILLRIYPGKGHELFPEEVALGLKFFDYALKLRDLQRKALAANQAENLSADSQDQPFVLDESLLSGFRNPPFFGDMLNGDVYPKAKEDLLPESERVGIPDLDIAQGWGYFHP